MNHNPALLVGRILASIIFILSGYGKATAMAGTVAYLGKLGVPAPEVAYYGTVLVELGGGLLLLVGLQTRLVALVLALFCIATALLAHADFGDRSQQINFLKNLAMAGGYLAFVAAGPGLYSLDAMLNRRRG